MAEQPDTLQVVGWLTGITAPVHGPLAISTVFRVINLSLDIVLFGLAAGGVTAVLTGHASTSIILMSLVIVALAKASAYYLEQFTGHYVAFKALELLRTQVFSALLPGAPAVVANSRSGDLMASLTRDVDRIEVVYAHTFAPVISALVVPVATLSIVGATWGWHLIPIPLAAVLTSLLIVPFCGFRSSLAKTAETLALRRDLTQNLTDSVFGIEEVTGYGREEDRKAQADSLGRRISAASATPAFWVAFRRAANLSLMLISLIALVLAGLDGGLALWVVAAFAGGSLRLFEGPRGIEDAVGYLDHSLASARRLWEISHTPPSVVSGQEQLKASAAPRVVFEDVTFSYSPNRYVVNHLSFTVEPGSHTTLVGPSGGGKSTALRLLLRFYDPNSGSVQLDGKPVGEYTLDSLRSAVVPVPQHNQLLDTTILENLRLGAPSASEDEAWAALETAHLAKEVREMPQGLATPVGKNGSELSGGQAQRLCLARALVMQPKVLVLDEFTANLNRALETEVRKSLRKDHPDLTILEVAHSEQGLSDADQVIMIQ